MTPSARVAAAIEILDKVLNGEATEKALTTWARRNRYAGSGDRAAVRDLVFQGVRCRSSCAFLGGATSGRGLMIGLARMQGMDLSALFSGAKYAPDTIDPGELPQAELQSASRPVRLDVPDWTLEQFEHTLGAKTDSILDLMRSRAPVFLRLNSRKTDMQTATQILARDGITVRPHPLSPTALEVVENPRRVAASTAYRDGLVELQDAASQAVVDLMPVQATSRVLDYCAGGGGKALALAARGAGQVVAHDALPDRMKDIPNRASRAGVTITVADTHALNGQLFDLVLCDVPCSGSGAWRRAPDGKWALTPEKLATLVETQAKILTQAADLTSETGVLAYVTCSLFARENGQQVETFLQHNRGWQTIMVRQFTPEDGGDGFFVALFNRI